MNVIASEPGSLRGRDLLSVADLSREEVERVFERAAVLKAEFLADRRHAAPPLVGRTLAMLFQKPSLRTRVTFEAGMNQLGGHAIYLTEDVVMGARESVRDVARNLERFVDAIVARTGPHEVVEALASQATIPVINGLTLREHPCQALADLFTIRERFGALEGRVLAFVGDGNNVYHSLALLGAMLGLEVRLAHPAGYGPNPRIVERAEEIAAATGARLEFGGNPARIVHGADVVYTDAWTSMGQEAETEARRDAFADYQLDDALLDAAGPDAVAMHCLPAHRGQEITSSVMDGPRSIIWDQSENRLHVQKALLVEILGR
ncbi:MAG TPA: ornithine carbamoyltransferase [Candidatus Limnocylindrales bacterium]|nr:ornithine carbamoyltransferase [Candidatus Limnocylindrales bacterium]